MLKKILICLAVVLCLGATAFIFFVSRGDAQLELVYSEAEKTAAGHEQAVRSRIMSAVNSKTSIVYVYDANDTLLFRLLDPSVMAGVSEVPETLIEMICDREGISRSATFDYGNWKESQKTVNSMVASPVAINNSLLSLVVSQACADLGIILKDAEKAALMDLLKDMTEQQLIAYITTNNSFAGIDGLVGAANTLFSKEVSELNSNQAKYLGYAYRNDEANFADYARLYPNYTNGASTDTEFGLYTAVNDTMWLVRKMITSELQDALKDDLFVQTIHVKTSIDKGLQLELQNSIDSGMRYSVQLSSIGNPVMNGAACAIDVRTGMYMALVSGRSIGISKEEITVTEPSPIGKYQSVIAIFDGTPDCTAFTLLKYQLATGEEKFAPLLYFVKENKLDYLGITPNSKPTVTLTECAEFINATYVDTKLRFVVQVKDAFDNTVYSARPANDIADYGSLPDFRVFLADGDPKAFDYTVTEAGLAYQLSFSANSEYAVCSLFASMAAGTYITEHDQYTFSLVHDNLYGIAGEYRPRYPEVIDNTGKVSDKITATRTSNLGVIQLVVEDMVNKIDTFEIVSIATRMQFESYYAECESILESYEGLVDDTKMAEFKAQLESHRAARSEDLMKYLT